MNIVLHKMANLSFIEVITSSYRMLPIIRCNPILSPKAKRFTSMSTWKEIVVD